MRTSIFHVRFLSETGERERVSAVDKSEDEEGREYRGEDTGGTDAIFNPWLSVFPFLRFIAFVHVHSLAVHFSSFSLSLSFAKISSTSLERHITETLFLPWHTASGDGGVIDKKVIFHVNRRKH